VKPIPAMSYFLFTSTYQQESLKRVVVHCVYSDITSDEYRTYWTAFLVFYLALSSVLSVNSVL